MSFVECQPGTFRYTVQPNDSMFTIAGRFHVSLDDLVALNPHISDPSHIEPGQAVCVPGELPECPPGYVRYTVQDGDTMLKIARRFCVSLDALLQVNQQLEDPTRITADQAVFVPKGPRGVRRWKAR